MPSPRRPNTRLRTLLAEARWTQVSLARAVNALASEVNMELSYDRTAVAHWLSGTQPNPPVPELVAEALTRRLGRTIAPAAAGFGSGTSSAPHELYAMGAQRTETSLQELCEADADPAQRLTSQQQPYREADLVEALNTRPCRRVPAPRSRPYKAPGRGRGSGHTNGRVNGNGNGNGQGGGGNTNGYLYLYGNGSGEAHGELGIVRYAVRFYAASFDAHGGGNARSALSAYLADDIAPRLRELRGEDVRRGLLVEASHLSFLLARMYQDTEVHGLAQRHFLTALRLAQESGDPTASSIALRGMSAQALALGHRRTALDAAVAAAETAGSEYGRPSAYLLAQLAVTQATCGMETAARETLARAESAVADEEENARVRGPFERYSRAALEYQSAAVLRETGDVPAAREALSRSLARRPAEDRRGLALSHARKAEILVATGHVEEACASWRKFLDHYPTLRSGTADSAFQRLRQLLAPFRQVRAAEQLLDRAAASALHHRG
ncbi:hypothetical protein [Streptomyces daliensis]